ncbi:FAD-dependent oxidoreductase [Methylobacterium planeticum]|uniref:NAD(P)/FAD-dependent oxidoreductase n=1 Tax=Methylobacterium planeticum TaxID=2615211 RepID=A0A6N6MQK4_9HYPH|nr:FAD-dependent oxidoreductase [Methylobacterium planeticum]KAB1072983.1 NAD(P)/FAD-dependent oxidoreductase [Methylobacterium planeticum]
MTSWTRRELGIGAAALGSALGPARAQAKPRVVVIGGGIGGATAAKYLAAGNALDVTLVEPQSRYATCIFSNLYLAGLWSLESLTHGYGTLAERYGVTVVKDAAAAIDPAIRRVRLAGGASLAYDRLVVSPGIAFQFGEIDGYDEAATEFMPHAWSAGPQTRLLRARLEAMEDGGVFVIVAPPEPFRCPPGPYERASLAAYYFKQFKPRSKIVILDVKDSFYQQEVFRDGWDRHYPGMIEWLPARSTGGVKAVDVRAGLVRTGRETIRASVTNVIPRQTAGAVAHSAGLVDARGWCPIDPETFESRLLPGIHVVGDAACAGDMPKSAFCANAQAKACAAAILTALTGARPSRLHLLNTFYTFLAGNDAMGDAAVFTPADGTIKRSGAFLTQAGEQPETRRRTAREAVGWYDAFTRDVFG